MTVVFFLLKRLSLFLIVRTRDEENWLTRYQYPHDKCHYIITNAIM